MTRIAAKLSLLAGAALLMFAGTALANEKCATCHADIAVSHAKSYHAKVWAAKKSGDDCASCHGGTDAHIANPSKDTIITFGKNSKQSAEKQSAQCLSCHASSTGLTHWSMGQHKKNDVACTACHSVHNSAKPQVKQPDVCYACHKDTKAQANKPSHHPIKEGKIKCSDCHNTHGTLSHGMIRAENNNQLCYKCHAEKRGPYMWEHPPVEEDCLKCHAPHGTKAAKLLVEKVPNLCQNCHDWSRHPGSIYDAKTGFSGSAPSNRFFARSCTNCHSAIHGSNAPHNPANGYNSGKAFTR